MRKVIPIEDSLMKTLGYSRWLKPIDIMIELQGILDLMQHLNYIINLPLFSISKA